MPGTPHDIKSLMQVEYEHIKMVLEHFEWNRTYAARALGISLRTMRNRIILYKSIGRKIPDSTYADKRRARKK